MRSDSTHLLFAQNEIHGIFVKWILVFDDRASSGEHGEDSDGGGWNNRISIWMGNSREYDSGGENNWYGHPRYELSCGVFIATECSNKLF